VESRLKHEQWLLLAISGLVPLLWLAVLRSLRPDLIAGTSPLFLAFPLGLVAVGFVLQLYGFIAVSASGLSRLVKACVCLVIWLLATVVFTAPTLFLSAFGPIVSAYLRTR
jgi:hypothetical protein